MDTRRITNQPTTFVYGYWVESIKHSDDQLGESVPYNSSPGFCDACDGNGRLGIFLEKSFAVLYVSNYSAVPMSFMHDVPGKGFRVIGHRNL